MVARRADDCEPGWPTVDYRIKSFMNNYHLLTVKYIGPSYTRGSRIKISSERFKDSRTFSFDRVYNSALDQALVWVQSASGQFNVIGTAEGEGVDYIITDTFKGITE